MSGESFFVLSFFFLSSHQADIGFPCFSGVPSPSTPTTSLTPLDIYNLSNRNMVSKFAFGLIHISLSFLRFSLKERRMGTLSRGPTGHHGSGIYGSLDWLLLILRILERASGIERNWKSCWIWVLNVDLFVLRYVFFTSGPWCCGDTDVLFLSCRND
jgi:hypothetical protein